MQQCLSVKHREWTRVASQKSEGNLEDAMQQRQTWEWISQKEVPGLPAFAVCLFRIVQCGSLKIGNSSIVKNKIVSTPAIHLMVVFKLYRHTVVC